MTNAQSSTLTIAAMANAVATGATDAGDAAAGARVVLGVEQVVDPFVVASATLTNAGTLSVLSSANAKGKTDAFATALLVAGVVQFASASGSTAKSTQNLALNTVTNNGTLTVIGQRRRRGDVVGHLR